jgi:hypothetical protein
MKNLIGLVAGTIVFLASNCAPAQQYQVVQICGSPPQSLYPGSAGTITMDTSGKMCVNATVSASVSGFAPGSVYGTPVAVTTTSSRQALPAGAEVVAYNTGANAAFCQLGTVAVVATTSNDQIAPGGFMAFAVGGNTNIACITSSGTTTVNTSGGTGLPTGSGGGGGGGGGGGTSSSFANTFPLTGTAIGVKSGVNMVNLTADGSNNLNINCAVGCVGGTFNNNADAVATSATNGQAAAWGYGFNGTTWDRLRADTTNGLWVNVKAATGLAQGSTTAGQTGSLVMGAVTTGAPTYTTAQTSPVSLDTAGNVRVNCATGCSASTNPDPCAANVKSYTPISMTTATTTRIIAPVAAKKTYICALVLVAGSIDNVAVVEGTGGTCGTGTAGVIGGTTAANGLNLAANGGLTMGSGSGTIAATAGTNVDFCLITSSAGPLSGHVAWVQQ